MTAASGGSQRRPIVLVLGMHCSGTSLCSHILSALGVDIAADNGANASNPGDHWERREIVHCHDRILGLFNRTHEGLFHDFALPVAWWADPRVVQIKREIVAFLERRMGGGYFGFKDLRAARLMPMWHQIFSEINLSPKLVLCLRNPAQVARSLQARNGLDPEIAEYRWLVYIVDFFRYAHSVDVCMIEYERWFSEPATNLGKLQRFLDLQWQQSQADLDLTLSGIIDPAARRDDRGYREASQPLVRSLYKLIRRAGEDAAAPEQIAHTVSQFLAFQQLQSPFLRVFEGIAETAARYADVEQELTASRLGAAEREAVVKAAERRADAAEAHLGEALVEIERQRAQVIEIERQRDALAAIEGEVSTLKALLAEREASLEAISRRAEELQSVQSAQAALTRHEEGLRLAEREAQERATVAKAAQTDAATLSKALAQAEKAGSEWGDALEAVQAESAVLRRRLADAEDYAMTFAAAPAAMLAEIDRLRGALAEAEGASPQHSSAAKAAFGWSKAEMAEPRLLAGADGLGTFHSTGPEARSGAAGNGPRLVIPPVDDLRTRIEASGLFTPEVYLSLHEDLRAARVDPWNHFLNHGLREARPFTNSEVVARLLSQMDRQLDQSCQDFTAAAEHAFAEADDAGIAALLRKKGTRIGIFCSSRGDLFSRDIADLIARGLQEHGVEAVQRDETASRNERLNLRVFVAPHEFFYLGYGQAWAPLAGAANSVLYNVEQMQTQWFCRAFPLLLQAPLVLDINFQSAEVLRRAGCNVVHFMPGHLPTARCAQPYIDIPEIGLIKGYDFSQRSYNWVESNRLEDRPIDILFTGRSTPRCEGIMPRLQKLSDNFRFICIDTHQNQPLTERKHWSVSEIKCALGQRTKIMLSIHRDWLSYFEWSRMVMQGFWQGACVVSDPGMPNPIYQSGVHFLEENIDHIGELIAWLLGTREGKEKLDGVRMAGYNRACSLGSMRVALSPVLQGFKQLLKL
jgi:hypothetical protein